LDFPQKETLHGGGVSEELNVDLTAHFAVKSITAYRENRYELSNDSDATELALSNARQSEHQNQFSQEITMQGRFERFDGVAGLYYLRENILANINNTAPAAGTFRATQPHVTDDAPAIFAQGTFKLTPALHLTLGARYTEEEKKIFPNSFIQSTVSGKLLGPAFVSPAKATYSAFTPKFGVEWQVSDQALVYVSATRGYKSGGFNYAATSVAAQQFAPETIWSYEAGAKTEWLDRRLRVNLTGFRYNYTGLQVQTLLSPGVAFIGNAATARIKGAELELTGKPIPSLTLISNTSFLDAKYGSFPNATVPAGLVPYLAGNAAYNPATGAFNASGNTLTAAPRISTLAAVQYDHHLGSQSTLYGRVEYSWQSRTYYDPSNAMILSQGPYGLLNLAVGFRGPSELWTTQILVKNVTDKGYWITTAANGPVPLGNAGPPRTVWASIARKW
jgi:iron complex outermembrane receptor protein